MKDSNFTNCNFTQLLFWKINSFAKLHFQFNRELIDEDFDLDED